MAMATNNIEMGSVQVFFKGPEASAEADLGYTNGGAKLTVSQETTEVEVDQLLDPVDELITKRTVQIEVPVISINAETLQLAFPGSTIQGTKLILGSTTGKSLKTYAGELRLHPVENDATDYSEDWFFPVAAPVGNIDLSFAKGELRTVPITFKAYPNEDKKTMVYGSNSASASA